MIYTYTYMHLQHLPPRFKRLSAQNGDFFQKWFWFLSNMISLLMIFVIYHWRYSWFLWSVIGAHTCLSPCWYISIHIYSINCAYRDVLLFFFPTEMYYYLFHFTCAAVSAYIIYSARTKTITERLSHHVWYHAQEANPNMIQSAALRSHTCTRRRMATLILF